MASPEDILHDIPDPEPLLPGIEVPLWFWVVLVTGGFAAAAFLYFYLRGTQELSSDDSSSFVEARESLTTLADSHLGRPFSEVAVEASLIMRHYLVMTLHEPALYETHEEFIMRSDSLAKLPTGARNRLGPLLNQLAEAKYGPSSPDEQASTKIINSCLEVLRGLESTLERNVA